MGFGLHQGWAIEGTIGSYFKIDASYLSPNVNMAARLEAATKQYDVLILISGEAHDVLSSDVKTLCREIDCVTVKGSIKPTRLFTVNLDPESCTEVKDKHRGKSVAEKKLFKKQQRKKLWEQTLLKEQKKTYDLITEDPDWQELRQSYHP
jgi:Adenylate and Guanylate cyclase catalytic domain